MNLLASSSLFTHLAVTEQHYLSPHEMEVATVLLFSVQTVRQGGIFKVANQNVRLLSLTDWEFPVVFASD